MAINFPSSPTVGQTYTVGNITWTWSGSAWKGNATGAMGVVTQSTAPSNTAQLWIDTTTSGATVMPVGGAAAQVLQKNTSTNYDYSWVDLPQAAGKNAIINGAFDFWQRGTSFTNGGSYTADRWLSYGDGSGATKVVSQQAFTPGAAPVAGYEGTYFFRFNQTVAGTGATYNIVASTRLEDVRTFAGQTTTFSFWAKADSARTLTLEAQQNYGTGGSATTYGSWSAATITTSTVWQRFSVSVTFPSISGKTIGTGSFVMLNFYGTSNTVQTIDLWGVQLEAGSQATPFVRAGGTLQGELAACQRYYWRWTAASTYGMTPFLGISSATNACQLLIRPPVTMRAAIASLDIGGAFRWSENRLTYNSVNTSTAALMTSTEAPTPENCWVQITATTGSPFTAGRSGFLTSDGNATSYIGFNAEL
jgi:hypothetical protein